jgi:hypothetical protein
MSPIAGIVVTLSLLAMFIVGLIVGSYLLRRRRRRIRQQWADEARARGWSYVDRDGYMANAFGGKPFRRGVTRSPEAVDVISGRINDHPVVAFRYRYVKGTDPDNLSAIHAGFTICAVRLPDHVNTVPVEQRSLRLDPVAKRALRGSRYRLEGSYLLCWERGTTTRVQVAFARLDAMATAIDGRDGRVTAA